MGWLIALAVVIGIGWIPLGAQVRYDEDGLLVRVIASFLRFTVFPMPGKKKPKEKKPKASPKKASGQPKQTQPAAEKKGGKLIKSPMIGTFYASSAPGKPPFVKVDSQISKGDVVCIVESMKLMNEITSEFDGTVTEILVNDGDSLEFDQPIMRVE